MHNHNCGAPPAAPAHVALPQTYLKLNSVCQTKIIVTRLSARIFCRCCCMQGLVHFVCYNFVLITNSSKNSYDYVTAIWQRSGVDDNNLGKGLCRQQKLMKDLSLYIKLRLIILLNNGCKSRCCRTSEKASTQSQADFRGWNETIRFFHRSFMMISLEAQNNHHRNRPPLV